MNTLYENMSIGYMVMVQKYYMNTLYERVCMVIWLC